MHKMILALALLPLAACTTSTADRPPQFTAREEKELARLLTDKVPGEPLTCITAFNSSELRALGDDTLIYRVNKNLVYRNTLQGGCSGLSRGDTLVMNRTSSSQYCRGDIARVVNLPSGMMTGSCVLGEFVPYRTPGK